MKNIARHKFEAVSLLTTQNGQLEITVLPAEDQPDWLVPTSLVLAVENCHERIWDYNWNDQDVAVYSLMSGNNPPDKIVILEGNTSVYRLALQISGNIITKKVRISDVSDTQLPKNFIRSLDNNNEFESKNRSKNVNTIPFVFQAVTVEDELYIIPDLYTIACNLVDLDS